MEYVSSWLVQLGADPSAPLVHQVTFSSNMENWNGFVAFTLSDYSTALNIFRLMMDSSSEFWVTTWPDSPRPPCLSSADGWSPALISFLSAVAHVSLPQFAPAAALLPLLTLFLIQLLHVQSNSWSETSRYRCITLMYWCRKTQRSSFWSPVTILEDEELHSYGWTARMLE